MPPELATRARRISAHLSRLTPYRIAALLLTAALAAQSARLAWAMFTPINPLGAWRAGEPGENLAPGEILRGTDPFFRLEGAQPVAAAVTSLQLALFGTRLDSATGRGSAIIATPDGVQNSFSVGDEIVPGVTLKRVAFDHVTLARGGVDEELFLDQSGGQQGAVAPVQPVAAEGVQADGTDSASSGVSLSQLRSDIGFIPRIDGGRVTGLAVRPQGSGEVFRKVGFNEGDVVTQIGGQPVTGPNDLQRVAASFFRGGNLSLSVERGAEVLPLAVMITGQ